MIFHCEAGGVPRPSLTWTVKSGLCKHHHILSCQKYLCIEWSKAPFLLRSLVKSEESDECWIVEVDEVEHYIWLGSVRNCFSDGNGDVGRV